MAKTSLLLVSIFVLSVAITGNSSATPRPSAASNYVKASCSSVTYPQLCVKSLGDYSSKIQNNPHQLALTALSVSLDGSNSAQTFVKNLGKFKGLKKREYAGIRDCLEEIQDTTERLQKSIKEMSDMTKYRGSDFIWHMSNVQTWVSAALTDENTCLDGFAGRALDGKTKSAIRARIVNVAQLTSNALALCNSFASKKH